MGVGNELWRINDTLERHAKRWVLGGPLRTTVVVELVQPMTVKQVSRRALSSSDCVSKSLRKLQQAGIAVCLTPNRQASRVYALGHFGRQVQRRIRNNLQLPVPDHDYPIDTGFWRTYAWCTHKHLTAILGALDVPRRPAGIKKRARFLDPSLTMSTNNCWDAVQRLKDRGVIRKVAVGNRAHWHYAPTGLGRQIQRFLWGAL